MGHNDSQGGKTAKIEPVFYRTDLINGAMGAQRLTNQDVADRAGIGVNTVSAIRNGSPTVGLPTLKAVLDALGLTLVQVFEPAPEATQKVA